MSARRCRLEFVRIAVADNHDDPEGPTHKEWMWRFISANGSDELARSSESYKRRVDAISCAGSVTGCYYIRESEANGLTYCWRSTISSDGADIHDEKVDVRWLR